MSEHTLHSIGETVERHYKDFRAFAARTENKTDKALKWWEQIPLVGADRGLAADRRRWSLGGWLARLV